MKKRSFLAIFMVFVLCLSMMLAGCQDENTKEQNNTTQPSTTESDSAILDTGKDDPTEAPSEDPEATTEAPTEDTTTEVALSAGTALSNTMEALCTTDRSIPVLEDLSEKKVITATMDGVFSSVMNLDAQNMAFYDELSVTADGETVTGKIYCDGKDLAATSPELLGKGVAVGVNFSTFADDLVASGLLEALLAEYGMDLTELEEALNQYSERMETTSEDIEEIVTAIEDIAQGIEYSESHGTATVYGAEVDAVIYTYTLDKDDCKKIIDLVLDLYAEIYQQQLDSMPATEDMDTTNVFEEAKAEIDAVWGDAEMSSYVNYYANPDNGCLMMFENILTGTIEGEKLDTAVSLTFGENPATSDKYVLAMDISIDDAKMLSMEAALTTGTEGSVDTTTVTLDAEVEGEDMGTMSLTATYDNDTTAYQLTLEADGEKISANGTMDSTDEKFVLTLDTLEAEGETLPLGITLSIEGDPDCEIPDVPEYLNILTELGLAEMLEEQSGTASEEIIE